MRVIHGLRPVAGGLDIAIRAVRREQDRFATSAAEIARNGASFSDSPSSKEARKDNPMAQTPPNPGPPGGAEPGDLAEAMIDQKLAVTGVAANVKTLQAFDAML